jgi:murein DD-endopeptidase / murein LD-carboxypeptidase
MMKKLMASSIIAALLIISTFSTAAFAYSRIVQPSEPAPVLTDPTAPTSTQADKLIAFAVSLQGKVQYGYSKRVTSNPNKMILDCSSFTQYVYKQALGVKMGWGANKQYNAFPHITNADLRKGDLVFFSVSNPSKIGHVGIYIGDGKFIHNVNPKSDVVIADLTKGYWKKHYIDASRPIS